MDPEDLTTHAPSSSSFGVTYYLVFTAIVVWLATRYLGTSTSTPAHKTREHSDEMSRFGGSKARDTAMLAEIREITGATQADAMKLMKKHKTVEGAIDGFFNDPSMQAHAMGTKEDKTREKKLGEIWERFKDPSDPKLIKIEGTMQLCEELDIDPESDSVLFCLATDLGSKATGEWEKGPWVSGWSSMPGNIDSIAGMKARLPALRQRLNSEPAYFKKVYMHTFDLAKAPGARTLALDTALDMWNLYIPPALKASPSALSHVPSGKPPSSPSPEPPQFSMDRFNSWIEFQRQKGKAVSKDTWNLFIDFVRTIDADFKEYDEEAAWPSTIDDFVEYVRNQQKGS